MMINPIKSIKNDKDLSWFFGFSAGDGYSTYGRYGIDTTTSEIVKPLMKNISKLTMLPIKAEIYGNPNKFKISCVDILYYKKRKPIHSEHIKLKVDNVRFAKEIKEAQREIVRNMLHMPKETASCFLQGFFDAEATVSPNGILEIDLSPDNQELAETISGLLEYVGIKNKVFVYPSRNRITVTGGSRNTENLKRFRKNVNFRIRKKRLELDDMISVYSLPIDKRSSEEIEILLLALLQKHGCLELKKCMKELNVKLNTLKKAANRLCDSGVIMQSLKRKRSCLEYLN